MATYIYYLFVGNLILNMLILSLPIKVKAVALRSHPAFYFAQKRVFFLLLPQQLHYYIYNRGYTNEINSIYF